MMKITSIEGLAVKGMVSPMCFCAIRTDEGLTGYSEFGNGTLWRGMLGLLQDLGELLIGQDPRPVERHYRELVRYGRTAYGGATQHAIAGLELALWDLKAKALGVPVYELFGGPLRDKQAVYWSHLGTYESSWPAKNPGRPMRNWDDLARLVELAKVAGYHACKTNINFPGDPPRSITEFSRDRNGLQLTPELLKHVEQQIGVMRQAAGPDFDIALDINMHFRTEGAIRVGRALESKRLMWLEIDNLDPDALAQLKASIVTPICSGEQHLAPAAYWPYLERHAMDVVKVDVPWQGFIPAREVASLAALHELNIAPHNYNGHLSTFQTMNFCACVPNVRISESDPTSVPWRDELFTRLPEVTDGFCRIPTGPGWGTDLNEQVAARWAADA
jgi:galactonate dehydratase